jgi:hypothetical protein
MRMLCVRGWSCWDELSGVGGWTFDVHGILSWTLCGGVFERRGSIVFALGEIMIEKCDVYNSRDTVSKVFGRTT